MKKAICLKVDEELLEKVRSRAKKEKRHIVYYFEESLSGYIKRLESKEKREKEEKQKLKEQKEKEAKEEL